MRCTPGPPPTTPYFDMSLYPTDIADVPAHFGSLLDTIIRWFRVYKVPDGKPENEFGFDSQPQDAVR